MADMSPDDFTNWLYDVLTHHHNMLERLRGRSQLAECDMIEAAALAEMYAAAQKHMKARGYLHDALGRPDLMAK
jgi:hypothetical protein